MTAELKPYRLEMIGISKAFPGVQALSSVTIKVLPGEVHALVGENGAGKSTLIKILSGAYQRDEGTIRLDGHEVEIASPRHAIGLGIVTIYQEANLVPELSVAENIFLGRFPLWGGQWVRWDRLRGDAKALLDQLNTNLEPRTPVKELSAAQRQMVEIAKALSVSARVIVFDEPTASLTMLEVEALFRAIRRLRDRGVSIIFISHRLRDIFEVADRVTVLRDGHGVSTSPVAEVDEGSLVLDMVGRRVEDLSVRRGTKGGEVVLRVNDLCGRGFGGISFEVRAGEVVGLFGLVGAGRTELVRSIVGAEVASSGIVELHGQRHVFHSPKDAIRVGLALAPEDRKLEGLVLGMPVRANITLPSLRRLARFEFINQHSERTMAAEYIRALDIRCPSAETAALSLSGGNQQKVVIAKWLARKPTLLILDEPTRGIDVAGKAEVHRLMGDMAERGVAILMVSSELAEVLRMSDRILVMREGALVGELDRAQATEENVMYLAAGQAISNDGEVAPESSPSLH